jgi:hypothetical protein
MADKAVPPTRLSDLPVLPSRALGPLKGEAAPSRPRARGRLNVKAATGDERVELPKGRGPAKAEGQELRPRVIGGKKGKPTGSGTGAKPGREPARGGDRDQMADQVAPRARRTREGAGRYVRFRVRVEGGATSIVDSHVVESDLVMASTIHGEYVYEVTDGARLVHADTIPDLGVVRSFSDPKGMGEQLGHHISREPAYEFDVRVPAEELTGESLGKLAVVLYRAKERAPNRTLTRATPLGIQFERELREVARLARIPNEALPSSLQRTPRAH